MRQRNYFQDHIEPVHWICLPQQESCFSILFNSPLHLHWLNIRTKPLVQIPNDHKNVNEIQEKLVLRFWWSRWLVVIQFIWNCSCSIHIFLIAPLFEIIETGCEIGAERIKTGSMSIGRQHRFWPLNFAIMEPEILENLLRLKCFVMFPISILKSVWLNPFNIQHQKMFIGFSAISPLRLFALVESESIFLLIFNSSFDQRNLLASEVWVITFKEFQLQKKVF